MEKIDIGQLTRSAFFTTTKIVEIDCKDCDGKAYKQHDMVRTFYFKDVNKRVEFTYKWGQDEYELNTVDFELVDKHGSDCCDLFYGYYLVDELYPSDIDYFTENRTKDWLKKLLKLTAFRRDNCISDYMYCMFDK